MNSQMLVWLPGRVDSQRSVWVEDMWIDSGPCEQSEVRMVTESCGLSEARVIRSSCEMTKSCRLLWKVRGLC